AALVALAGCVNPSSVQCADGRLCPSGTVCTAQPTVTNAPGAEICAPKSALSACVNKQEGADCDTNAVCHDGVCTPIACGNGYVDPGEECDDHNNVAGDGCSADCKSSELCGNGVRDGIAFEECDDGNLVDGDGCDSKCTIEQPHWIQLTTDQITARRSAMA